jgi:hypothetical protein
MMTEEKSDFPPSSSMAERMPNARNSHAPISSPGIPRKKISRKKKSARFERLESSGDDYVRPQNAHRTMSLKNSTSKDSALKSFPFPPGMRAGYPRGMPSGL